VIPPGADAERGPGGEAAQAVRLQPLGAVVERDRPAHRRLAARRPDAFVLAGTAATPRRRAWSSMQRSTSAVQPV